MPYIRKVHFKEKVSNMFQLLPKNKETPNYFEYNDGGRKEAGYKGSTGDCVVRSIAIAAELPYQKVYDDLFDLQREFGNKKRSRAARAAKKNPSPRNGVFKEVYDPYIKKLGFKWVVCSAIGKGCTVHLHPDELPKEGRLILRLSGHISCFIDGEVQDTYDPSREGTRQVYGYYIKNT